MGTASAVLYDEGSIESVYRPTDNRMRIESNKFSCSQQKPFHCSKKLIKVKSARVPAHQQGAAAGRWSAMGGGAIREYTDVVNSISVEGSAAGGVVSVFEHYI